jgi:spore coat polysaccharide biosynthesis predicted glycosyltransferase SpsG
MASALVLADGGPSAGQGHLSRSSSLVVALRARGVTARCVALGAEGLRERYGVTWEPEAGAGRTLTAPADVVVVDTYGPPWPASAGVDLADVPRVLVCDEPRPPSSAVVVDPAAEPDGDPRHLYGLRHAMLGPPFWGMPRRTSHRPLRRVLVTVGRSTRVTEGPELVDAVRAAVPGEAVVRVVGLSGVADGPGVEALAPSASLLEELLACDLVVCGAGQTMLEAAATGAPCVAVVLADNQRRAAEQLDRAGAAVVTAMAGVAGACAVLVATSARAALAARGQDAIDGAGALRVAFAVQRLIAEAAYPAT